MNCVVGWPQTHSVLGLIGHNPVLCDEHTHSTRHARQQFSIEMGTTGKSVAPARAHPQLASVLTFSVGRAASGTNILIFCSNVTRNRITKS